MIYLDNNASTAVAPEAWRAMEEAAGVYGNPSSVHGVGQLARRRLEEAREEVAGLVGARPGEVVWTSGGTEANALAILGACAGRSGRVVISAVEHPSVRECAARLAETGEFEVVAVAPDSSGELDPERVLDAVTPDTVLLSIMAANNSLKCLVAAMAAEARRRGVWCTPTRCRRAESNRRRSGRSTSSLSMPAGPGAGALSCGGVASGAHARKVGEASARRD
jgi:cysteine desulfurase